MRVIQATDYGSPFPGSFVPMLAAMLGEAAARGWNGQAVLPARAREREWLTLLAEHESQVLFAPQGSRREAGRWLQDLVADEEGPLVLHSHFSVFDFAVASAARRRENVRALWHIHTVLGERMRVRLGNRYKLAIASRPVERILCVAPHLAEGAIRRGAPAEKVVYFPNGLDTGAYSPAAPWQRSAARELLGLPQEATVLLHFGRDWLPKGGDVFLEAVRLLRERGHEVVALCARGGEPARALAAEARNLGGRLDGRARLHAGPLRRLGPRGGHQPGRGHAAHRARGAVQRAAGRRLGHPRPPHP